VTIQNTIWQPAEIASNEMLQLTFNELVRGKKQGCQIFLDNKIPKQEQNTEQPQNIHIKFL
jgi:hypothetical protein